MNRQVTAIAPRTQTHVHPKHEAIGGVFIEQFDDALSKASHKAFVCRYILCFFAPPDCLWFRPELDAQK